MGRGLPLLPQASGDMFVPNMFSLSSKMSSQRPHYVPATAGSDSLDRQVNVLLMFVRSSTGFSGGVGDTVS
jgi:hypothetical protein